MGDGLQMPPDEHQLHNSNKNTQNSNIIQLSTLFAIRMCVCVCVSACITGVDEHSSHAGGF